jgi:hypothetical protein
MVSGADHRLVRGAEARQPGMDGQGVGRLSHQDLPSGALTCR